MINYTRRRFLKTALASTSTCGLAPFAAASANVPPRLSFVDTHVYVGHWPHRRLASEEPDTLLAQLRKNDVTQAWVGSFDGLFHKDVAAVNQRLAETCRRVGDRAYIPFGTINPMLPDWEDDIRRCHEVHHMPGIRLHPNYHGYTLADSVVSEVLKQASNRGLIVQLVASLDEERHQSLSPPSAKVDLRPLEKASLHPNLRLVVTNGYHIAEDAAFRSLVPLSQVYFDFARASSSADVRQLGDSVGVRRVVFGSGEPLHAFESVGSKAVQQDFSSDDQLTIANRNASRLVSQVRLNKQ
jgi:predicted TIM-barrel fold metal-dependent hydrolase